jgi:hypothetical protein
MTSASTQAARQAGSSPIAATPTRSSHPSREGSEDPFSAAMDTESNTPYLGESRDSAEEVWSKLGQVGLWIDTHNFSGFGEGDRDYIGWQLSAVLLSAEAAGISLDRPRTDTLFDRNPPPPSGLGGTGGLSTGGTDALMSDPNPPSRGRGRVAPAQAPQGPGRPCQGQWTSPTGQPCYAPP